MKLYFIRAEYKLEDEIPHIFLWGRRLDTFEKILFKINDFEPYFYVLEKEQMIESSVIKKVVSGYTSIFGEPCKKIIVVSPENVVELRKYFSKTFEADIPFTRRFLIDTGIRRYFTVPDGKTSLSYTEIEGE